LKRLLVTDLDNTLYDWVTFFSRSFSAMVDTLSDLLGADRETLLDEYREIGVVMGSLEHPYASFDLPAVKHRYPGASLRELKASLDPAFHAFNSVRNRELRLYPGVEGTLATLHESGVAVVGYTESTIANAWFRLAKLRIDRFFDHLFVLEGSPVVDPVGALQTPPPPPGFVEAVPEEERKPNPRLLLDIARRRGFPPGDVVYVGDSRSRDVAMAHRAGITAAWARYGTIYDEADWLVLTRVTHWSPSEVTRDRSATADDEPDVTLNSFDELLSLFPAGVTATEK